LHVRQDWWRCGGRFGYGLRGVRVCAGPLQRQKWLCTRVCAFRL